MKCRAGAIWLMVFIASASACWCGPAEALPPAEVMVFRFGWNVYNAWVLTAEVSA